MSDSANLLGFDAVIYSSEINDRHGVGVLLQRIFPSSTGIISIRAENWYGGEHTFGQVAIQINHRGLTRALGLQKVAQAVANYKIDRILCIPYQVDEVLTALALHELFRAPICTYIMDDQNVLVKSIPDHLMAEVLTKSQLCLGISPELCDVYRTKYAVDMHFVPPVLPEELVNLTCSLSSIELEIPPSNSSNFAGVMIGNVWSPTWLKLLQTTIREAGITLDWYGNTGADWNIGDRQQLLADGIIEKGFLPTEAEVILALSQYKYAIVPSGTLDLDDGNPATAWLSLPSRIPFMLATSHIPIITMGHRDTGAARFVESMGIGIAADYEPHSLLSAIARITQPDCQKHFRQKAASLAPLLINHRTDAWLWDSLAIGKPVDQRFQKILTFQLQGESSYLSAFTQALDTIGSQRSEITSLNHALILAQQSCIKNQQIFDQQIQELQSQATKSIRSRLLDKFRGMSHKFKGKLKKHLKKLIHQMPKSAN